MHRIVRADGLACQLRGPICDYFIGIGICTRARAGLKNVERKMFIEFSIGNFFGGLHDQRRALGVEQTKIVVRLRGRPLD